MWKLPPKKFAEPKRSLRNLDSELEWFSSRKRKIEANRQNFQTETRSSNRDQKLARSTERDAESCSYTAENENSQEKDNDSNSQSASNIVHEEIWESPTTKKDTMEWLVAKVIHANFSREQICRAVMFGEAVTGFTSQVEGSDIWNSYNILIKNLFNPKSEYFCHCCHWTISGKFGVCANKNCTLTGLQITTVNENEKDHFYSVKVEPQLRQIVSNNFKSLLNLHEFHHRNKNSTNPQTHLESYRVSNHYYNNIETLEQYNKNEIVLPISLSFDGFTPEGISTTELTPLYVRVEGLTDQTKRSNHSMVIAMLARIVGGVKTKTAQMFSSRFYNEISMLNEEGMEFWYDNVKYTVRFKVCAGIADLKGIRSIYKLPNWQGEKGCHFCNVPSYYLNRSYCFFDKVKATKRSQDDLVVFLDGVGVRNSLRFMLLPNQYLLDELHLWGEGIAKQLFRDITSVRTRWRQLRLKPKVIARLDSSLKKTMHSTKSRCKLLSMSMIAKMTGSEISKLSRIIFPLLGFSRIYSNINVRSYLALLPFFFDQLLDIRSLDVLQKLEKVRQTLKAIHGCLSKQTFNMKIHILLDHAVEHVYNCGSLRSCSSAEAEKCHQVLKRTASNYCTSLPDILNRYLIKTKYEDIDGEKLRRLEKQSTIEVNKDVVVPAGCFISQMEFRRRYPHLISLNIPPDATLCSRVIFKGKLIESGMWRRKRSTPVLPVTYYENEHWKYGNVHIFYVIGNCLNAIVTPWKTTNPFVELHQESIDSDAAAPISEALNVAAELTNNICRRVGMDRTVMVKIENIKNVIKLEFNKLIFGFCER